MKAYSIMQIFKEGKGNKAIDKTNAKRIENGKIILDLPLGVVTK